MGLQLSKYVSKNIYDPERISKNTFYLEGLKAKNILCFVEPEDPTNLLRELIEIYLEHFTPEDDISLVLYFTEKDAPLDEIFEIYERLNPTNEPMAELVILQAALDTETMPNIFERCQAQVLLVQEIALIQDLSLRGLLMNQSIYLPQNNQSPNGSDLSDLFWVDKGRTETSLLNFLQEFYRGDLNNADLRSRVLAQPKLYPGLSAQPANIEIKTDPQIARFGYEKQKSRNAFVLTMPRSGTWYHIYFFTFYNQMCQGYSAEQIIARILNKSLIPAQPIIDSAFGPALFNVKHSICPGFKSVVEASKLQKWNQLEFYANGFIEGLLFTESDLFSPQLNPDVRIVYVYRNPLDQAVSFFKHLQKHVDKSQCFYQDAQGNQVEMTTVSQYFRAVGLESYLKQYLTFKWTAEFFPEQIKLMTYEALTKDPSAHFQSVLAFLGDYSIFDEHMAVFQNALKYSDKDAMKKLENKLGGALGNDQTDRNERHIRSGAIGQWRQYLSAEDLDFAEEFVSPYGVSLSDFVTLPEQLS